MATVSAVVIKHHKKSDGTWNVKIRVGHKGKSAYLDTKFFVTKSQLTSKFKIKDHFLLDLVEDVIRSYRKAVLSFMDQLDELSAAEIKERLLNKPGNSDTRINFITFCSEHIEKLIASGKQGSVSTLKTVMYSLISFFNSEEVYVTDITSGFLETYEQYLKSSRVLSRSNQGKIRSLNKPGLSTAGLHNHMRDLRLLFNACRNKYNDDDLGIIRIKHYPFKKYKIPAAPLTENRNRSIEEIIAIRDLPTITPKSEKSYYQVVPPEKRKALIKGSRAELARDLFMLSFYLLGMNAADIYHIKAIRKNQDRLEYNRAKTKGKRKDQAHISIKIIPEARVLLEKYAGKLQDRYSQPAGLNAALNKGLVEISKILVIEKIDFYDARHSVGSLARNVCGFSRDDVAMSLNHIQRSVTDIYIARDWSIVDRVQESIVSLLQPPSQ